MRSLWRLVGAGAIAAVIGIAAAATPAGATETAPSTTAPAAAPSPSAPGTSPSTTAPGTATPTSTPGTPPSAQQSVSLYHPGDVSYYAYVETPVLVRTRPSWHASVVESLGLSTADGTSMLVEVIAEKGARPHQWLEIHMPVLPNSRVGWVPRNALSSLRPVHTWLIIDTERLRATLIDAGRVVFSARIGVGKRSTPTPHGNFYVIDRLEHLAGGGVYGPLAFGTSAKSAVLTEWPGGGVVGVHGTDEPQLIPGYPSHGCIRMRDEDIVRLGHLMPVGTPITIE